MSLSALHPTYTLSIQLKDVAQQEALMGAGGTGGISGLVVHHSQFVRRFDRDGVPDTVAVVAAIKKALADAGLSTDVTFERFDLTA